MTDRNGGAPAGGGQNLVSLRQVEVKAWVLAGLLTLSSLVFRSRPVSLGVALGGLLAIFNYLWLKRFVRGIVARGQGGFSKVAGLLYLLKYPLTSAVIFGAIKYELVNVFGLLAGLLVVIMAITLEGIAKTLTSRKEDRQDAP